jgi:hypothetical protein
MDIKFAAGAKLEFWRLEREKIMAAHYGNYEIKFK